MSSLLHVHFLISLGEEMVKILFVPKFGHSIVRWQGATNFSNLT